NHSRRSELVWEVEAGALGAPIIVRGAGFTGGRRRLLLDSRALRSVDTCIWPLDALPRSRFLAFTLRARRARARGARGRRPRVRGAWGRTARRQRDGDRRFALQRCRARLAAGGSSGSCSGSSLLQVIED